MKTKKKTKTKKLWLVLYRPNDGSEEWNVWDYCEHYEGAVSEVSAQYASLCKFIIRPVSVEVPR